MFNNALKFAFSEFKTKFQIFKTKSYPNLNEFYHDLLSFQANLDYLQLYKYEKALLQLTKKCNKMVTKSNGSFHQFLEEIPLSPSKTYQFIYSLNNKQENYHQSRNIKTIPLNQLYSITDILYQTAADPYHTKILNIHKKYKRMRELMEERTKNLQEQLCLHVFEDYERLLYEQIHEKHYNNKPLLKNLKDKNIKFKKDFKFNLRTLSPQQHQLASHIAYKLAIFSHCSPKLGLLAQKTLRNYKQCSPQVLRNYLFNLAYHLTPLPLLQSQLYEIGERLSFNSIQLLFYMLVFRIDNFILMQNLVENSTFTPKHHYQLLMYKMMKSLIKQKYDLTLKNEPILPSSQSSCHQIFQKFLQYQQYSYIAKDNRHSDDVIYQIEGKKFICMKLQKMNSLMKVNGIGSLALEGLGSLKVINVLKTMGMQKRGERFDYFRSKMKGIAKPIKVRVRKYEF